MDDSDSDYDTPEDDNRFESDISRGPLRVENIDQIPILKDMFNKTPATTTWVPDTDLY